MGERGSTTGIVLVIIVGAIIMFVVPLMITSGNVDDVTNLAAQEATAEFGNKIATTGKLTQEDYDNYVSTLAATGRSYEVELTVQMTDDNNQKRKISATGTISGENEHITLYNTQIGEAMTDEELDLPEGSMIVISYKTTDTSVNESLTSSLLGGSDSSAREGSISVQVTK